jgi:dethiobiotin synthase
VGKTLIAAGLLKALRNAGVNALPAKPVQTGRHRTDGRLSAPDLEFSISVAELRTDTLLLDLMCPFRYSQACSPHLAGRLSGVMPDIKTIHRKMEKLSYSCDFIVAEGAGGVMVPINESEKMLDLMVDLKWPVILVARGELGTINHTLLSLEALHNAGMVIAAVIVNHISADTSIVTKDNPGAIAKFGEVSLVMEISYIPDPLESGSNVPFMKNMLIMAESILEER